MNGDDIHHSSSISSHKDTCEKKYVENMIPIVDEMEDFIDQEEDFPEFIYGYRINPYDFDPDYETADEEEDDEMEEIKGDDNDDGDENSLDNKNKSKKRCFYDLEVYDLEESNTEINNSEFDKKTRSQRKRRNIEMNNYGDIGEETDESNSGDDEFDLDFDPEKMNEEEYESELSIGTVSFEDDTEHFDPYHISDDELT